MKKWVIVERDETKCGENESHEMKDEVDWVRNAQNWMWMCVLCSGKRHSEEHVEKVWKQCVWVSVNRWQRAIVVWGMWPAVTLMLAWMTEMMMRVVVVDCIEDGCNTPAVANPATHYAGWMVDQQTSIRQHQFIRTQNTLLTFCSNKRKNQNWFYSQVQLHRLAQLRLNSKFPMGSRYLSRHPLELCHPGRFCLFSSFVYFSTWLLFLIIIIYFENAHFFHAQLYICPIWSFSTYPWMLLIQATDKTISCCPSGLHPFSLSLQKGSESTWMAWGTEVEIQLLLKRFPDSSVSSLILVGRCEEGHPATKNSLQHSQG